MARFIILIDNVKTHSNNICLDYPVLVHFSIFTPPILLVIVISLGNIAIRGVA